MNGARLAVVLACGFSSSVSAQSAPQDLQQYVNKLQAEGEQNRVLNQLEIGTRQLWASDMGGAAVAFDDAIEKIEMVYSGDPAAAKARSLWHEEGAKSFKGEPYERAMAYYYRGLVYLQKGDYENARAAFKQGQLQDAFAEEEQFQTDFALLLFLEAWASHLNGDDDLRDEALKYLTVMRPDFPGIKDDQDTLVLVETGTAPRKLGDGSNHSYFVFRRGKGFKENRAVIDVAGTELPLYPMEDIYYQAATRGGREIDKILKGKASFRQTAGNISDALATGSTVVSRMGASDTIAGIGAGLAVVSAIAAFSSKPKADTRAWLSLPDTIHVATLSSKKQPAEKALVRFFAGDIPDAQTERTLRFQVDPNGRRLALTRSR